MRVPPRLVSVGAFLVAMAAGLAAQQTVIVDGAPGPGMMQLMPGVPGASATPLEDGDGRYTFREVPKGGFSVTASKPGYSDGAYGRLRPDGPAQPLQLTDGQRVTDVTLPLWKLGTIAGTGYDD